MNETLIIWLIGFALPATVSSLLKFIESNYIRRGLYVHILVAISVGIMLFLKGPLAWNITPLNLALFGTICLIAIGLNKRIGLIYSLSVLLQEWCLLLSVFILYPSYNIWIATGLTAILFFTAHNIRRDGWWWKPLLLYTWVLITSQLYIYTEQVLIGASFHLLIGSILIHEGSLLRYRFDSQKILQIRNPFLHKISSIL